MAGRLVPDRWQMVRSCTPHLTEDGSYVARRVDGNATADIALLGFMHGGYDFNADGDIVYADDTQTWFVSHDGGKPIRLGEGIDPRFALDGRVVLTYDAKAGASRLMGLDGKVLASVDSPFVLVTGTAEGQ